MSGGPRGVAEGGGALWVAPLTGMPEVAAGDDLAALLVDAAASGDVGLRAGDCLVVSSKVVSKSLGLTFAGERSAAVAEATVRVVAERSADGGGVSRVVESAAGPVMAAAGVDASNTGPTGAVLLLPTDPDGEAARLRSAVLALLGLPDDAAFGLVLSDTAGRPWRAGLTDLALGSAGLAVLDDLRGGVDHDGRPLAVTARAVADELAGAADLVKGKASGVPAAVVRGVEASWFAPVAEGARSLVRTGRGDWFALGHVEAVRAALGVSPGSVEAEDVGIPSTGDEPLGVRVGRVVALALLDVASGSADVGVDETAGSAEVTLSADDPYELGRLVTRCRVAAASESLTATESARGATTTTITLIAG
ncbi:coenzyme F420-0:L-glutamate ligase [Oryzobacter sp. R7]|uniref:coenzyme F420-0:L-glutamate ligase n=1 Tax=Oryzobacter faecalis TaxID=3388656 RepID=UPI00398CEC60